MSRASAAALGAGGPAAVVPLAEEAGAIEGLALAAAGGRAWALWRRGGEVFGRLFSGAWEAAARLDAGGGAAAGPEVALAPAGDGIAIWSAAAIEARALARDAPGAGVTLAPRAGAAASLAVGSAAGGAGIAAWTESDGVRPRLRVCPLVSGRCVAVETLDDPAAGVVGAARVAVAPDGRAVVVWEQTNGAGTDIWAAARE